VSIKNKLVTAVTTAGLLAGLFGSAFVPSVRAATQPTPDATTAAVCVDDASAGYEGTIVDGGGVTQYYGVVGKKLIFSYCTGSGTIAAAQLPDADAVTTVTVTVTGGTISAYTPGATHTAFVVGSTSMTFSTDATADATELAATKVTVTAASTVGTVKVTYSFRSNSGTTDASLSRSVKTVAASAKKVTTSVGTNASTATVTGITVDATTTNWSDAHDSDGTIVVVPKNAYGASGTAITGEVIEVASGNANLVTVAATNVAGIPSCDDAAATATASSDASGVDVIVCPVVDAAGTTTLTFKSDGVVILTKTYTVVGPVASITPVALITHVAVGGSLTGTSTVNLATITAKDAAGTAVTIASYTYYVDGFESATVVDDAGGAASAYVGFTSSLCATAGTTKSIVAKSTYANADGDDVTVSSAAWTITCTGASGIITKIVFDKASYLPSSTIKIQATATDTGGRPLGYGAAAIESGAENSATADEFTVTKQGSLTLGDVDSGGTTTEGITFGGVLLGSWINGVGEWTATSHNATGDFGLVIAVADNDGGATGTKAESFTAVATVSNILASAVDGSLAVGPKKLKATATFGLGAAGKKIAFTLENASTGAVKTYYRKANASGVATFTLSFRGTFEVTAAWGDYMTDSLTLKK